ncbi:hypothetical protein J5N97_012430 [Dioscorea zingiberensis]|uniref:Dirigent protein n=1 Tax=Dioscorea zingiberensis TaxID=325984 RepID=A0A9D5CNX9_9LILI|nr:hypothetical protein J5N97_012430 [Dioscorea zingiberensis]
MLKAHPPHPLRAQALGLLRQRQVIEPTAVLVAQDVVSFSQQHELLCRLQWKRCGVWVVCTPLITFSSSLVNSTILISILLCAMTGNSMATKFHHPNMEEKMTHLHFYVHSNFIGSNPMAPIRVVKGPKNETTLFGSILVMDNPVTAGPEIETELIGQAQGFAVGVVRDNSNLLYIVNLVFTGGKYKGSTLSAQCRTTSECWIIGGTGKFRLARGYGMLKSYSINKTTGVVIVEIDAFVLHY